MLAQLSRSAVASSLPIPGAETFGRETSAWRVALVAPPGLFRDGFAHLIATFVAEFASSVTTASRTSSRARLGSACSRSTPAHQSSGAERQTRSAARALRRRADRRGDP